MGLVNRRDHLVSIGVTTVPKFNSVVDVINRISSKDECDEQTARKFWKDSFLLFSTFLVSVNRYLICSCIAAYFCPNWNIVPYATRTHTPGNTWCRAPGMLPVFL